MYWDWFYFFFYSSNPSDFKYSTFLIWSICDHQSNINVASKSVKSLVEFNENVLSIFGLGQDLSEEEIILNIWELNESCFAIEDEIFFFDGVYNSFLLTVKNVVHSSFSAKFILLREGHLKKKIWKSVGLPQFLVQILSKLIFRIFLSLLIRTD